MTDVPHAVHTAVQTRFAFDRNLPNVRRPIAPLNSLRAFEAAARHGSFRAASDELCVSHSAISHQVKQLEQYLKTELFLRKTRSVELTKSGRMLYRVLRDSFDRIADCTDAILAPRRQDTLTVRLYSTFAVRWLIPRLPKFQALHPEIKFRLNSSQMDVDFDRDDVDACIFIGKATHEELSYTPLFGVEVYPVCSPRLKAGNQAIETPADLVNQTILQVLPSQRDWVFWLEHWEIGNVDPDAGLIFDSYDHSLSAAREGVGVALGMQPYVAKDLRAGVLVEALPAMRVRLDNGWFFVTRKERVKEPKIAAFRTWLLQEVASDPDIENLETQHA